MSNYVDEAKKALNEWKDVFFAMVARDATIDENLKKRFDRDVVDIMFVVFLCQIASGDVLTQDDVDFIEGVVENCVKRPIHDYNNISEITSSEAFEGLADLVKNACSVQFVNLLKEGGEIPETSHIMNVIRHLGNWFIGHNIFSDYSLRHRNLNLLIEFAIFQCNVVRANIASQLGEETTFEAAPTSPDDDDNLYYMLGKCRPIRPVVEIKYKNSNGSITDCVIDVIFVDDDLDDDFSIYAFCRLQSEEQTFNGSGIIEARDEFGELIRNVKSHLLARIGNLAKASIRTVYWIALADGSEFDTCALEARIAIQELEIKNQENPDAWHSERYITTKPSRAEIKKLLSTMSHEQKIILNSYIEPIVIDRYENAKIYKARYTALLEMITPSCQ